MTRARWMPRVAAAVLVAAVVIMAAALLAVRGDDEQEVEAGDELAHPEGRQVVVQVRRTGGLRPAEMAFTAVPRATLLGDGTLVFEGAQIAIYPPPALPSLWQVDVGDEGVDVVLRAADDAGLLTHMRDYGRPPIADATTTVIEIHAAGDTYVHEIVALGAGLGDLEELAPGQRTAREEAADFVSRLVTPDLGGGIEIGDPERFRPDAVAIRATPADDPAQDRGGEVVPDVENWPLPDVDLASAPECVVVDGAAAEQLLDTLEAASAITRFEQDGVVFSLQTRVLLPPEDGCADVLLD